MLAIVSWHMVCVCILSHKRELICAKASDPQWDESAKTFSLNKLTSSVSLSYVHYQVLYLDKVKIGSFKFSGICMSSSPGFSLTSHVNILVLWSGWEINTKANLKTRRVMFNDNWFWISSNHSTKLNKTS